MLFDVRYSLRVVVRQVVLGVNWQKIDGRTMVVRREKPRRLFEYRSGTVCLRRWTSNDYIDCIEISIGPNDRIEQLDSEVVVGFGHAISNDGNNMRFSQSL